jgi:hypothetical protein
LSTLTKVFIVLMVVFAIAFTMTTIAFVGRTTDWRSLATGYQAQTSVVETHMRNLAAAHAAEKTVWYDEKRALDGQLGTLRTANEAQGKELSDLRDRTATLEGQVADKEALARGLVSQNQVTQDLLVKQQQQRQDLETRNNDLETRNLQLSERVNELTAQMLVLVQQQQQLEQQVNMLRGSGGRTGLSSSGGGSVSAPAPSTPRVPGPSISSATTPSTAPIRGRIVEVDGNLASISVGSADGVQSGTVFVIYRGQEYVGDMEVTDVEPNLSAGRIIRSRSTPRPSDQVTDEAGSRQNQ